MDRESQQRVFTHLIRPRNDSSGKGRHLFEQNPGHNCGSILQLPLFVSSCPIQTVPHLPIQVQSGYGQMLAASLSLRLCQSCKVSIQTSPAWVASAMAHITPGKDNFASFLERLPIDYTFISPHRWKRCQSSLLPRWHSWRWATGRAMTPIKSTVPLIDWKKAMLWKMWMNSWKSSRRPKR